MAIKTLSFSILVNLFINKNQEVLMNSSTLTENKNNENLRK